MRRFVAIIAATLVVAACSRPEDDDTVQIDLGTDAGSESPDLVEELPVLASELVAGPTRDGVDEVRILDAGEFLFLVQDDRWFAWLSKDDSIAIEFASWPDATRPDDGPPSLDAAFDDTYLWFLSEYDGGWNLAGVEHFLGNASPLFGQPIIIIDLGPIQKPRGIERYDDRFVIPTDGVLIDFPGDLIIVGENLPPETTRLDGVPLFDHFDGWLAQSFDGRFQIDSFDEPSRTFRSQWDSDTAPLGFAAEGVSLYVIRNNGELWQELQGVKVADAEPREGPLIDVHSSVVAWTATDGIRLYDGALKRIEATDVDAIVVDDTFVWWSNADGVHRSRIE